MTTARATATTTAETIDDAHNADCDYHHDKYDDDVGDGDMYDDDEDDDDDKMMMTSC
jgi:hypothetical protein